MFDARTKSPQRFRRLLSFVARASQPSCLRLLHFANTLHQTVKTSSALRRLKPPTTTASADFCGDIDAPLETPGSGDYVARASPQISQGKTRSFPPTHPPHIRRLAPNDIGLRVSLPSRPASRRLVCGSCSSDREFACCFLRIPSRPGHPCSSARSSCHQGLHRDLHPTSYFPGSLSLPSCERQSMTLRVMPDAQRKNPWKYRRFAFNDGRYRTRTCDIHFVRVAL